MKKGYYGFAALAAVLMIAPAAWADGFTFSFNGSGISSSGTIVASPSSTAGVYHITDISGTFTDTNVSVSGAITGLYQPVSYVSDTSATPGIAFTTGGLSYDDLFYPAGDSPALCFDPVTHQLTYPFYGGQLDIYGVAFDVGGGYVAGLWSNGNIPKQGLVYAAGLADATGLIDNPNSGADSGPPPGRYGSFTTTPTPEPNALLLLGVGLLGLVAMRARKSKRARSEV